MLEGVKAMGYVEPTPIQLRAIPLILAGRDVIGSAQTGTGKTAAFALPIFPSSGRTSRATRACSCSSRPANWPPRSRRPFAISPASPISHVAVVFGGVGYGKQKDALEAGVDIIVATPGRLLDHMQRGTCRLDKRRIPGAGRSGPHARHGFPARRAAHRAKDARATGTPRCFPPPSRRRSRRSSNGR